MSQRQLPLPLSPSVVPSFDNYLCGDNGLALDVVKSLVPSSDTQQVYLWGGQQSGKTHLLLALHNDYVANNHQSFYVSLKDTTLSSALFSELDGNTLIALDDIDQIANDTDWEQSLFNLINFSREQQGKMIFSAGISPVSERWELPDLSSRLSWGPVLKLEGLGEDDIRQAVMMTVESKGLRITPETVDYLLKHHSRDVSSLLETVSMLDREALAAGKADITIPFLKACLLSFPPDVNRL